MPLKRITKGGTDFRVGLQEMEEGAEMAISQYTTLAFIDQLTLLGLEPITGKTHQLRKTELTLFIYVVVDTWTLS